jgi:hypothetical protein
MSVVALSREADPLVDGIRAMDCRDLGLLARGLVLESAIAMRFDP